MRVPPGGYLAREEPDGSNPGERYVRLALVQDHATTGEALKRLAALMDS